MSILHEAFLFSAKHYDILSWKKILYIYISQNFSNFWHFICQEFLDETFLSWSLESICHHNIDNMSVLKGIEHIPVRRLFFEFKRNRYNCDQNVGLTRHISGYIHSHSTCERNYERWPNWAYMLTYAYSDRLSDQNFIFFFLTQKIKV